VREEREEKERREKRLRDRGTGKERRGTERDTERKND